jgi:hypothetical protein
MHHNQEMVKKNGARWGDKVRIIGASIDEDADTVVKHVKDNGWEDVENYHLAASSASDDYEFSGIPHVVLIDIHGNIAYKGHPGKRNLEEDIETLLKGEKLAGIRVEDEAQPDVEDDASFKDLDLAKVDKEIAVFTSKATELTSNADIKSHAAQL